MHAKSSQSCFGGGNKKELAKISLSDSTAKTRIDKIAEDIELQILEKINKSFAFATQCDETTDVAQMFQLLVYIRFVGSTSIEEEMLFCKPLQKTTKAKDMFENVFSYFDHNLIKREIFVGVCTDGAPEMLGS